MKARLPESNGRLAVCGASRRLADSARMRLKPAMAMGSTHASAPPGGGGGDAPLKRSFEQECD